MWFDDLTTIKYSHVLSYIERRFGASRWDGKVTYQDFFKRECISVQAWAKKRKLDAWKLMAAARYCAEHDLPVLAFWDLEKFVPAAVPWMQARRELHDSKSFDQQYTTAIAEAYESDPEWHVRLVACVPEFREETYKEWLQSRGLPQQK